MAVFASRGSSSTGYWRGGGSEAPLWQGQGSGYGQATQGIGVLPPGDLAQGGGRWTPTIVYLFILVLAEMILAGCLERWLR